MVIFITTKSVGSHKNKTQKTKKERNKSKNNVYFSI